jgi:serine/threonine-protein kinase HipA
VADAVALAEIWLWDRMVGAVAEDARGVIVFEYAGEFARQGLEISPLMLPLARRGPATFPELARLEAFGGLPGVLADALPDRFGNAVIRKYFTDRGEPDRALSPVQKLLYVGARAMGALEFRPAVELAATAAERESLEVARLVAQARRVVEGATDVAVPEIMRLGASAGGARPKALILWNRAKREVRSAFARRHVGDEHWIIKFDGVGELEAPDPKPQPYNRIEFAYSRLARAAGIAMPDTLLLQERRLAHFMVRRFDRAGDARLHMHTLGGMRHVDYNQPGLFSYEEYLRTVLALNLGYPALEEAYRRAVFNVALVNQDDHVKNVAFLMASDGRWSLAPAYDLTYAKGAGFTRAHQMTLGGKAEGITRGDLLALGAAFGIRHDGAPVVEQVLAARAGWKARAREAGVAAALADRIAAQFPRLS